MTKLFAFPGQGSQYSGMGKDWYENFNAAKLAFEEASDHTGLNLKKLCFEGSDSDLAKTEITQPAILTTTVAVFRSLEIDKKALYAGHSLGEYSALVCAGALSLGEAARLVQKRGQLMQEAVPQGQGKMAAVIYRPGTDGESLTDQLCLEASEQSGAFVSVANYNTPEQIVISGAAKAVDLAMELAKNDPYGARKVVPLNVSAPFHCSLMKPAAEALSDDLTSAQWKPSENSYIANVDAKIHRLGSAKGYDQQSDQDGVAQRLIQQIDHSVRWSQSMKLALDEGVELFVEVGPGAVLSGMAKRLKSGDRSFQCYKVDKVEDFKNDRDKI